MSAVDKACGATLGTAFTTTALALAVVAVGPTLRAILGPPAGYGSDVTSRSAYIQAVTAQLLCVAFGYFILGIVLSARLRQRERRWAWWAANPLTVGLAYWLFRLIAPSSWPYEYKAYQGWLVLTIVAPLILSRFASLGARLSQGRP
jgi:hypothetical protein